MKKFILILLVFISSFGFAQTIKQKDYYTIFRCDTVDSSFVEEYFIIQLSNYLGVGYLSVEFEPGTNFNIKIVEYKKKDSEITYRCTIELAEFFLREDD